MTHYCVYCKKEVIRGIDSYVDKKGRLESHHASCYKIMQALNIQYAHLLLGNKCKCCGSTKNIQAGHINFPEDKIIKNKRTKTGISVASGDRASDPKFLELIRTHAVIPVCASCNQSMSNGSICYIHNKYLGIWNYLPNLYDLEGGEEFQ